MGHFDIYIASLPLLPNELRATSLNRTTGLEIMYGCAKLIHRRESLYPSPPLVCKSTKLKLYDTFTNSDFILFCFVFLFFREQNLIQPMISRQFTGYELSARLESIQHIKAVYIQTEGKKIAPVFCYPHIFLSNMCQIGWTNRSKINLNPKDAKSGQ